MNPALQQQNLKLNYRSGYFAKTTGPEPPATRKRSGPITVLPEISGSALIRG